MISTNVIDNGVNINDPTVKHVVIHTYDRISAVQMAGRRRLKGKERINLYIKLPEDGKELLKNTKYQSDAGEAYEAILTPKRKNGELISITVTNYDTEKAVQFDLGTNADDTYILLPVRVPAGESVSRTVEITDFDALDNCPVYISVSCPDDIGRTLDLEISAVQIKK